MRLAYPNRLGLYFASSASIFLQCSLLPEKYYGVFWDSARFMASRIRELSDIRSSFASVNNERSDPNSITHSDHAMGHDTSQGAILTLQFVRRSTDQFDSQRLSFRIPSLEHGRAAGGLVVA